MKPLRFGRHARNRLRLWRLNQETISDVVSRPDALTPSIKERQNAWKFIDGHWVRVTCIGEGAEIAVVTITMRRQGPEGA